MTLLFTRCTEAANPGVSPTQLTLISLANSRTIVLNSEEAKARQINKSGRRSTGGDSRFSTHRHLNVSVQEPNNYEKLARESLAIGKWSLLTYRYSSLKQ